MKIGMMRVALRVLTPAMTWTSTHACVRDEDAVACGGASEPSGGPSSSGLQCDARPAQYVT